MDRGRRTAEGMSRKTGGSLFSNLSLTPCSGVWALSWGSEEQSGRELVVILKDGEKQATRAHGAGRFQKR